MGSHVVYVGKNLSSTNHRRRSAISSSLCLKLQYVHHVVPLCPRHLGDVISLDVPQTMQRKIPCEGHGEVVA